MDVGRRGKKKKFSVLLILIAVVLVGMIVLASRDIPAPSQPVTKTIELEQLNK